jgi:hypothetical protein
MIEGLASKGRVISDVEKASEGKKGKKVLQTFGDKKNRNT